MKKLTLFISGILVIALLQSCANGSQTVASNDHAAPLLAGCLASYELNGRDTINKVYGPEKVKHGHWVSHAVVAAVVQSTAGNMASAAKWAARPKLEEGYYR